MGDTLAHLNASLNGVSTILLVLGFVAIRQGKRQTHKRLMLSAFGTSALFLVGYLTRVVVAGTHTFPDLGWMRTVYLLVLFSHVILAAVVVPLIITSLFLAFKGRFEAHKKWVRFTWPIWLYVSVTGVVVYVMLYHVAPAHASPLAKVGHLGL